MAKTAIFVGFVSLILLVMPGCKSYSPVTTGEPVRIALSPIISQSGVPQIIAPLSRNLREQLNHAAGWKLVEETSAEVVLHIEVLGLERDGVARDPADTGRPLSYYESIRVSLKWESDLPPPWGADPVSFVDADSLIYAQPSLISSESIIITEMAEELARKIIGKISWPANSSAP